MSATTFDVLILGAGASGLYLAAHAAAEGRSVAILDHGPKPARKVLASGGGRCNLTNLAASPVHYRSSNPHFVKSALARHTPWDVLDFFAARGVEVEEKEPGQLFCTQGAGAVARALERACQQSGARLMCGQEIGAVSRGQEGFCVSSSGQRLNAASLVLALGSPAWPGLGATDRGYRLARSFGLEVIQPRPALAGLRLGRKPSHGNTPAGNALALCRELAGVSLPVRLESGLQAEEGDLLFTHKGLSGPAVFQLSLAWEPGMEVVVDFLPGQRLEQLVSHGRDTEGTKLLSTLLTRNLPKRLPAALLPPDLLATRLTELGGERLKQACEAIHAWTVTPDGPEGWDKAEVAAGGIATQGFSSKTMEATTVPGLFAVGEVLDVTGRLGGFNLQWAWSSAFAAARFV